LGRAMRAHIVLAHPEPASFNGNLARLARTTLEGQGWAVSFTDLYASGFDPAERGAHFRDRTDPAHFVPQDEQRHASYSGTIPPEVMAEIEAMNRADLVILQYPMWWHMPPAMLKGWFDRVMVFGEVYASKKRFEHGRFTGKRAMLSVTVATSAAIYAFDGRSGDIDLMLWPVNFSLAYVGFTVLQPFVAYGVESGIQYSDASVLPARLAGIERDLVARLGYLEAVPAIPFNRMSDWGPDGRIIPQAPAHSPFMRHREKLDLG